MTLTPNLSLLRSYLPSDDLVESPPAIAHFSRDGKDLFFINAHHVSGTDNPTCTAIRHVFETLDPRFFIQEGYPTAWGITPDHYLKYLALYEQGGFIEGGEGAFAASLAHARGIPFQGGEPTDAELLDIARTRGFSTLDFVGYELLLYVPQDQMQGLANTEEDLRRLAEDRLTNRFQYIPESEKPGWTEFLDWLARHRDGNQRMIDLTNEENMPSGDANATWLQRLTCAMTKARDEHLLAQIAAKLNEYGRVLVVYGDGHLVTTRGVLEDMMGMAEEIRP